MSKPSTGWLPFFSHFAVVVVLLVSAAAPATELVRAHGLCAATVEGTNLQIPIEVVEQFPANPDRRERVVLADDYRKQFAAGRTPAVRRQLRKMRVIKESHLQELAENLKARGMTVDKFKFVRVLPESTISGIGFELHIVLDDGTEINLGEVFYQAYGDSAKIISLKLDVAPNFRRLGISTILAATAIEDNPQTEAISSGLTDVNILTFQRALQMGLAPLAALEKTPALKLRKTLGYVLDPARSTIPHKANNPDLDVYAIRADLVRGP